ncbi:MAG: efflux RND transporter periplasmic adaptor subunit [Candidatus Aminicenantes bacterium]|nr:efflux RND transporter periplasmic adaptor subunit [Candidatus Aminicenantes bacterium]
MTRGNTPAFGLMAAALGIFLLMSCDGQPDPVSPAGSDDHAAAASGEEQEHPHLQVPPDKQKAWGIGIGEVRKSDLAGVSLVPGVMALNGNRTAHVTSFVPGRVASIAADLGGRVRKGQPLLTIDSPEFARAQAEFLEARARFNLGQAELRRAEALRQAKAVEEKEYFRRRAEHEKLAAEYGALGSKLHSYGLTHEDIEKLIERCRLVETQEYKCEVADPNLPLLSPLAGTVIFRNAVLGAPVEPDTVLYTVSDLGILWALLDVPEKDIPRIGPDSRVSIRSELYPGREFSARIGAVSEVVDEKLRTLRVRAEVENRENLLKPNMYVQGVLEHTGKAWTGVLSVPEEAVQTLGEEKIVFVREKDDVFAVRHVRLGDRVGDRRIILEGLEEGEVFVLKGAFTLKSELSKAAFGHGHVH